MPGREFGFICRDFSVGQSADGFVLPGSDGDYLGRSLVGDADPAELSGRYLLRVYCVDVGWGTHSSQAEPVLAIKADDPAKLTEALRKVCGKDVELRFTRITARN
jgi:hypothetical protein